MNKPPTDSTQPLNQQNPFPGLRPFEEQEARLFFGREREITALLGRVVRQHFLAVLGSSGCGKSSLIKAGLIPSLKYEQMDDGESAWRIAVMRPGDNPFKQLAIALTGDEALGKFGHRTEAAMPIMQMILRRGALGIVEAVRETELPPEAKLLVLVDQFEELFRFPERAEQAAALDEARAFVNLLLAAAGQRDLPIYVVLTMRSEFLGQCAAFSGLAEAITDGLYLLPDMARDQLREVIQQPVIAHHGQITERLINRLLNDLGRNADQLPILQHALMRLWAHWLPLHGKGPMDLQHYEFIGELKGSLSAHAEKIYNEELKSDRERDLAQLLFRSLTETTAEGQTVRNPTKLGVICRRAVATPAEVKAVIEQFRAEGRSFLMPPVGVDLDEETTIDISHESLIRQWRRLGEWAEQEAKESKLYADLKRDAASWRDNRRNPDWLYTGLRLAEAQEWAAAHPNLLDDDLAREFLTDSTEMRKYAGLLLRSQKWSSEGRDQSFLLRGKELLEAEQWLAKAKTDSVSRQRLPKQEMRTEAGANVLRSVLLRPEVEELVATSRRATRNYQIMLAVIISLFLLLAASALAVWNQRRMAVEATKQAVSAAVTANQQKIEAEAQKEIAEKRLDEINDLKLRLGISDQKSNERQIADAGVEIRRLHDVVKGRQSIQIRYFYKPSDGTKVSDSLKVVGYRVLPQSRVGSEPTNAIWWGSGIGLEDVKFIAYTLIQNGFEIRYIGRQERFTNEISIGGRPLSRKDPIWTVERVRSLAGLPVGDPPPRR